MRANGRWRQGQPQRSGAARLVVHVSEGLEVLHRLGVLLQARPHQERVVVLEQRHLPVGQGRSAEISPGQRRSGEIGAACISVSSIEGGPLHGSLVLPMMKDESLKIGCAETNRCASPCLWNCTTCVHLRTTDVGGESSAMRSLGALEALRGVGRA